MGTLLNSAPKDWIENTPESAPKSNGISSVSVVSGQVASSIDTLPERNLQFGEYSMSIDEVYRDIKRLTLSRNPLDLIFKANEIREKFAFFINSLASFISKSFSFDSESFTYELYHDSEYHRVWMELIFDFLQDIRYISTDFDVIVFASKNDDGTSVHREITLLQLLDKAQNNTLGEDDFMPVQTVVQMIISRYRKHETISKRLGKFTEISSTQTFKPKRVEESTLIRLKKAMDDIMQKISIFPYEKESFITDIEHILDTYAFSEENRQEIRTLIFRKIIEVHYPDVEHIFFNTNLPSKRNSALRKEEWLRLKWMQELTLDNIGAQRGEAAYKEKNREYFRHVMNCKDLILDLEGSILSPILLPIILKLIASAMTLDRKEFEKFSYILLFLFANSYENEYIPLARFLRELEVYINFANEKRGYERLKIGFSLIVLFFLCLVFGYFLLPPFVFIAGTTLAIIYLKMYFIDDYSLVWGIRYNTGVRLWAVILLAVFGYSWLTNIWSHTPYYKNLEKHLTMFGNKIVAEIIPPEKIAEWAKRWASSILEWNNTKK